MQDRFKLKFYYYELKKMFDVKAICYVGEPVVTLQYKPILKTKVINGSLIQCTGLKDKNGKLIYEGDIVKVGKGSVNSNVCENIYAVELITNKWNIPNWIENKPNFSHYVEVVGNKYENPELLKGGNND